MPDNEPIHWSTLTPNERNALVAQHVFGRKVVTWKADRDMLMQREGTEGHESIPKYSESLDALWLHHGSYSAREKIPRTIIRTR